MKPQQLCYKPWQFLSSQPPSFPAPCFIKCTVAQTTLKQPNPTPPKKKPKKTQPPKSQKQSSSSNLPVVLYSYSPKISYCFFFIQVLASWFSFLPCCLYLWQCFPHAYVIQFYSTWLVTILSKLSKAYFLSCTRGILFFPITLSYQQF